MVNSIVSKSSVKSSKDDMYMKKKQSYDLSDTRASTSSI